MHKMGEPLTDLNTAILEQLMKQNELLQALVAQGKTQASATNVALWHTRQTTQHNYAIRSNALRPLMSEVKAFTEQHQLGLLASVYKVSEDRLSFARFGDGELRLMLRETFSLGFQKNSPALAKALRDVYTSEDPNVLIGFPEPNRDIHWQGVWAEIWDDLKAITRKRTYGSAQVTRPSFFQFTGTEGVNAWRKIWDKRSAVVITGKGSRFDLIPELFDNLNSHTFLYSTPTNAFEDMGRVLGQIGGTGADIALISLGPTGTLMAAALAKRGIQAIDLGHISASYQHAFNGGAWPESTPASRAGSHL
ncbi:hypothetical protein BN1051_00923 [Arthrobacter saudimassiliensis]|uniref:Glycosyltransferase GT-D fold domain-containing protein n=1 Tax=Arthrobacter saudimassiliensis TaxID=1461584 RepID=A0A078MJS4_9MICC|nr:hypothetical protein BN1051_00923 [Arthrobacter saudimassiliensis]